MAAHATPADRPLLAVLVAAVVVLPGCGGGASRTSTTSPPSALPGTRTAATQAARTITVPSLRLASRGVLGAGVQAPATTALGPLAVMAGGLDHSTVSVSDVVVANGESVQKAPALPQAIHDAAATALGGHAYVFGGGEPSHAEIVRVGPGVTPSVVGRLPAPASDVAAATVGSTAYVVGGYTGTTSLDTIVAWNGAGAGSVVGHLPHGVRYAAVAVAGGRLVIAGGSVNGSATRTIYAFDPLTKSLARIGRLPRPLTHSSAAAVGNWVFLLGGRGSDQGTQTARILAIDATTGRVYGAGRLPVAVSDAGAATVKGKVILAGGRERTGSVSGQLLTFVTADRRVRQRARAATVAGKSPSVTSFAPATLTGAGVYAADLAGNLAPAAASARRLIYVPNSASDTVDEIDPASHAVVRHFAVGGLPQHIVPSFDLKRLYVTNDTGNTLTPIDPLTGSPGSPIPVEDPYNLYFTPDGRFAVVMAERLLRMDFRDAHTMRLVHSLSLPTCKGVNHADYTADGHLMLASCEFGSKMVVVDVAAQRLVRTISLRSGSSPQDVKLSPDGAVFYVADLYHDGLWEIDAHRFKVIGLLHTGAGAHGIYPSRDAREMYVSNRRAGTVSVIDFATRRVVRTWPIPGGGSPDMGGVSADGKTLWLSGRYNGEVYALDTTTGALAARIRVGSAPHGLCVWPQPGRFSLGHTGILR